MGSICEDRGQSQPVTADEDTSKVDELVSEKGEVKPEVLTSETKEKPIENLLNKNQRVKGVADAAAVVAAVTNLGTDNEEAKDDKAVSVPTADEAQLGADEEALKKVKPVSEKMDNKTEELEKTADNVLDKNQILKGVAAATAVANVVTKLQTDKEE